MGKLLRRSGGIQEAVISRYDNSQDYLKICLVGSATPYPAFDSVLSILIEILGPERITVLRNKDWEAKKPFVTKFFFALLQDLALYLKIVARHKRDRTSAVLIFQGYYPLTSVGVKLLNLKLLLYIGGSGFYWSHFENQSAHKRVFVYANLPIEDICHKLADVIITLSKGMVKLIRIEKHGNKTFFAFPRLDSDFLNQFKVTKKYEERESLIGFVGALSKRKGILNLLKAIPIILKSEEDCEFLIVGSGPLLETVRNEVQKLRVGESVKVIGFADNDCLKKHYNSMKLLIIPTYAEGIPSTIFEAMACGTPVLSTSVGGIQDVIKNGETGFLLRSNSPECIANRIIQLLDNVKLLEMVSINAQKYVQRNLTEEAILKSWKKIFQNLGFFDSQKAGLTS